MVEANLNFFLRFHSIIAVASRISMIATKNLYFIVYFTEARVQVYFH